LIAILNVNAGLVNFIVLAPPTIADNCFAIQARKVHPLLKTLRAYAIVTGNARQIGRPDALTTIHDSN
jgi:hypothetical protein